MAAGRGYGLLLLFVALVAGFALASAARPRSTVDEILKDALFDLLRRFWSFSVAAMSAVSGRSVMTFEGGYMVETVFDGSKLGVEPFAVEASPNGDLLVLDSANSNINKISLPLSQYNRPELVAGSSEGYIGHVDGNPRDAKLNHPKGFTVDARGNIYIADTMNNAIRKISDTGGVTTIAGAKWGRGDHVDGPSDRAKFSNDFDVVYMGSSCSLLVVDRGNKAIREIQLHPDDCSHQNEADIPLEILCLFAACILGYMLGLYKAGGRPPHLNETRTLKKAKAMTTPLQKHKSSTMPPLVVDDALKQEGLLTSLSELLFNIGAAFVAITGVLLNLGGKQLDNNLSYPYQRDKTSWPTQDIQDDELQHHLFQDDAEPAAVETKPANNGVPWGSTM